MAKIAANETLVTSTGFPMRYPVSNQNCFQVMSDRMTFLKLLSLGLADMERFAEQPNGKVQPRQPPAQPPDYPPENMAGGVGCNAMLGCYRFGL